MTKPTIYARPWLQGLYGLGALLIIQPLAEVLATAWPLRFGEVGWRFGVTGSFQLLISTFVVGIGVVVLAAYLLRQRMVLRGMAVLALVFAVMLVLATASFALDYVQLRRMVRPEILGGFDLAAAKAGVSSLLSILSLAVLGVAGVRASRVATTSRTQRRAEAGEGLIVGRT